MLRVGFRNWNHTSLSLEHTPRSCRNTYSMFSFWPPARPQFHLLVLYLPLHSTHDCLMSVSSLPLPLSKSVPCRMKERERLVWSYGVLSSGMVLDQQVAIGLGFMLW